MPLQKFGNSSRAGEISLRAGRRRLPLQPHQRDVALAVFADQRVEVCIARMPAGLAPDVNAEAGRQQIERGVGRSSSVILQQRVGRHHPLETPDARLSLRIAGRLRAMLGPSRLSAPNRSARFAVLLHAVAPYAILDRTRQAG